MGIEEESPAYVPLPVINDSEAGADIDDTDLVDGVSTT